MVINKKFTIINCAIVKCGGCEYRTKPNQTKPNLLITSKLIVFHAYLIHFFITQKIRARYIHYEYLYIHIYLQYLYIYRSSILMYPNKYTILQL